jgi:hypothetical protein
MMYSEPDKGDGGLLRGAHEAVRGAQVGAARAGRARLHRLHAHALPELSAFAATSAPAPLYHALNSPQLTAVLSL